MREIARGKMRTSVLIMTIVFSLCIQYGACNTVSVELAAIDTRLVLKQIWDRIDNTYTWIRTIGGLDSDENLKTEANDEIYQRISSDISGISLKMDNLKQNFDIGEGNSLRKLVSESAKKAQIIEAERKLHEQLSVVQEEFRRLVTSLPKPFEDLNSQRLCEYGNSRLKDDSLRMKIQKIFGEVYDQGRFNGTLMALLRENLPKAGSGVCGLGFTSEGYLHAIFHSVMLTEVQGFIALSFSHYFVHDYNGLSGCMLFT